MTAGAGDVTIRGNFIVVYLSMEMCIMNNDPRWNPPPPQYPQPPMQQPVPPYQQQPPNTFYPQQPGYYPPPQQPMYRPPSPTPPKKTTLSPRMILLVVVACVIVGAIGAVSSFFNAARKDAASTPTAQVQQAAQATPTKAPTQASAPTPTAVLTIEERANKILKEQGADMQSSAYITDTKNVIGTKHIGFQWDNDSYRDSIKMDCFRLQKALWTAAPSLELTSVTVFLKGDVVDKNGNESVEQVGACTLKVGTEEKFNWENLTWRTAWEVYDNKYYAPFLQ